LGGRSLLSLIHSVVGFQVALFLRQKFWKLIYKPQAWAITWELIGPTDSKIPPSPTQSDPENGAQSSPRDLWYMLSLKAPDLSVHFKYRFSKPLSENSPLVGWAIVLLL
jgi:hypothetical protein